MPNALYVPEWMLIENDCIRGIIERQIMLKMAANATNMLTPPPPPKRTCQVLSPRLPSLIGWVALLPWHLVAKATRSLAPIHNPWSGLALVDDIIIAHQSALLSQRVSLCTLVPGCQPAVSSQHKRGYMEGFRCSSSTIRPQECRARSHDSTICLMIKHRRIYYEINKFLLNCDSQGGVGVREWLRLRCWAHQSCTGVLVR